MLEYLKITMGKSALIGKNVVLNTK
jgi:hypothetical protein